MTKWRRAEYQQFAPHDDLTTVSLSPQCGVEVRWDPTGRGFNVTLKGPTESLVLHFVKYFRLYEDHDGQTGDL